MKYWFSLFSLLFLSVSNLFGQCDISAKREVCMNDLVPFVFNLSSGTITSYDWDFGAFGISSNASPLMQFTSAGSLVVRCTATLSTGQKCIDSHALEILPLPKAKFSVASGSLFCVHENNVCFNDSSAKAAKEIGKITMVWGDGKISQFTPPIAKKWCHVFNDTGWHKVIMEVEDSLGCKANYSVDVHIDPSINHSLPYTETQYCDSVKMCLDKKVTGGKNISSSWYWIPSNQSVTIQTPWCKVVQPQENVQLKIVSINEFGCKDSLNFYYGVPPSTFYMRQSQQKVCVNNLGLKAIFSCGEEAEWYLNGVYEGIDTVYKGSPFARFGMNYVRMVRFFGGCTGFLVDSFEVLGVNSKGIVYNDNRRKAEDTAFFLDITRNVPSSRTSRLWYFGDEHAEQCTTSTALGINVGRNCNFSTDSLARHFYADTACYVVKLRIFDTTTGCHDDSGMMVFRKDMCPEFFVPPKVCENQYANFTMSWSMERKVGEKNFLIMDINGTVDRDSLVMVHGYMAYKYKSPGLKSPVIWRYYGPDTIWTEQSGKMVIKSTRPGDGWVADTFLNKVEVEPQSNADFRAVAIEQCDPFVVRCYFDDSIWLYPDTLFADWGDTQTILTGFKDTFHKHTYLEHTYKKGGLYKIVITLQPYKGCSGSSFADVRFSHLTYFSTKLNCPTELVCFKDSVIQLGIPKVEDRDWESDGKYGQLYWDFGDGTKDTGYAMCHRFPGIGDYIVTLTARSIEGCDISAKDTIRLTAPKAGIKIPPAIYCNEAKQYFDSSFMIEPNNGQKINQWFWYFGDGSGVAAVKNPVHIFPGGGTYTARLIVKTDMGCIDSTSRVFSVIGPEVYARIVSDSTGCAPLKVEFDNLSRQSKSYIWQFGDPRNSVYSTDQDTNATFTYRKSGIYYAHIVGGDSFYNPTTGSKYYCTVRYPAPGSEDMKIEVYPSAFASFNAPDILCIHDTIVFENTSKGDAEKYWWMFGNDDSMLRALDTFKYKFQSTGTYKVRLFGQMDTSVRAKCVDTAEKEIRVIILTPDFKQECNTTGKELVLKNLSGLQIDGYRWTEMDPTDSSETLLSEDFDLIHDFGNETGVKWICLGLTNDKACGGKVCKQVFIQGGIFMANVFTPGKDGFNDTYRIPMQGYDKFDLRIFNRWGESVFLSSDPKTEWNGKVYNTGPELPAGTYFYRLNYQTSCDGKPKEVSGSITLIR